MMQKTPGQRWPGVFFKPNTGFVPWVNMSNSMTRPEAIRLALAILRPFAEAGQVG
jgi:hypothetical protein